jgi:hypothetical protein
MTGDKGIKQRYDYNKFMARKALFEARIKQEKDLIA